MADEPVMVTEVKVGTEPYVHKGHAAEAVLIELEDVAGEVHRFAFHPDMARKLRHDLRSG